MNLSYRYFRDAFITVAILSFGCLGIFWDSIHGRYNAEPGVLALIAVLIVVGNVGLFIAMRRAKRREQAEKVAAALAGPATEAQFEEAVRKRQKMRRFMSFWIISGGFLFAIFGKTWLVNGLPVPWVGYLLIVVGFLGLYGVNVFYGGPLDLRLDRKPHPSENALPKK